MQYRIVGKIQHDKIHRITYGVDNEIIEAKNFEEAYTKAKQQFVSIISINQVENFLAK